MKRFQYAVVRYVPNVVRGEAINVGVLIRSVQDKSFDFRFLPRSALVRRLWPSADQRLVLNFQRTLSGLRDEKQLALVDAQTDLFERIGLPSDEEFFTKARSEFNGNLQFDEERGLTADDLETALEWSYSTFVAEPQSGPRPINYQVLAPHRARERLWRAFEKRSLVKPGLVQQSVVLRGRHAPWTVDLAYRNGTIQVINSLALNAPTVETNLGRALVYKGMLEDVAAAQKKTVHGHAVIEVRNRSEVPGVDQAEKLLRDANVEVVPGAELDSFVDRVEAELVTAK
jgi:hypothetical protein